jgi:hypothetical protein
VVVVELDVVEAVVSREVSVVVVIVGVVVELALATVVEVVVLVVVDVDVVEEVEVVELVEEVEEVDVEEVVELATDPFSSTLSMVITSPPIGASTLNFTAKPSVRNPWRSMVS